MREGALRSAGCSTMCGIRGGLVAAKPHFGMCATIRSESKGPTGIAASARRGRVPRLLTMDSASSFVANPPCAQVQEISRKLVSANVSWRAGGDVIFLHRGYLLS
jgi:hypothetical protein